MYKLFIPILILFSIESYNQTIDLSVVSSAGDHKVTEIISISWTLGEIAVNTMTSEGMLLSQGFHQGNLFFNSVVGVHSDLQLRTYPNPVIDKLIIESTDQNHLYEIIDIHGKTLKKGFITSNTFELDFTTFPSGIYILKVDQRLMHKIIKK